MIEAPPSGCLGLEECPGDLLAGGDRPKAHATISLLPDCLASRRSPKLVDIEQVVDAVESFDERREAMAELLRPDIGSRTSRSICLALGQRAVNHPVAIGWGLCPGTAQGILPALPLSPDRHHATVRFVRNVAEMAQMLPGGKRMENHQ